MEYKFSRNRNYEDFASGRVLYHVGGIPNYPVRLVNEIYRRCLQYAEKKRDICIYDCCCGGGYALTVLGLLNQQSIAQIVASDIDEKMLEMTQKNLSLLTKEGILRRTQALDALYRQYQKESHRQALESAKRLADLVVKDMALQVFQADALQRIHVDIKPDIIITDVPYGNLVSWEGGSDSVNVLMRRLAEISTSDTIIAVSMDKRQKISDCMLKRLEKQSIGKRKFEIYRMNEEYGC